MKLCKCIASDWNACRRDTFSTPAVGNWIFASSVSPLRFAILASHPISAGDVSVVPFRVFKFSLFQLAKHEDERNKDIIVYCCHGQYYQNWSLIIERMNLLSASLLAVAMQWCRALTFFQSSTAESGDWSRQWSNSVIISVYGYLFHTTWEISIAEKQVMNKPTNADTFSARICQILWLHDILLALATGGRTSNLRSSSRKNLATSHCAD